MCQCWLTFILNYITIKMRGSIPAHSLR